MNRTSWLLLVSVLPLSLTWAIGDDGAGAASGSAAPTAAADRDQHDEKQDGDKGKDEKRRKESGKEDCQPHSSPEATATTHDPKAFRPDPDYGSKPYDAAAQLEIYGGKYANITQRPLLELGRELYGSGPLKRSLTTFGATNPANQQLLVSGDLQIGAGWNKLGDNDASRLAARVNLDVDWRLTATEHFHVFARPLDKNGNFTSFNYADGHGRFDSRLDGNADAIYFEGDLASIFAGWRGKNSHHDVPFAVGLMPLLFQNGIWVEDAFAGLAFTIPARHSAALKISNADITLFTGLDRVDNAGLLGSDSPRIFGVASFIEANRGYWEADYGYVQDTADLPIDRSFHSVALAFTRRYGHRLSNSVRVLGSFGQERPVGVSTGTADGVVVLIENSLITHLPSTLIPYLNLFAGFDRPQPLARDPGAGGILKNTGLLFEGNALTGTGAMESSANNTWGGAIGVEYLFALNRQIVIEAAALQTMKDPTERIAQGDEYGIGVRFQQPLSNAWILRLDGMFVTRKDQDDLAGVRVELRWKF